MSLNETLKPKAILCHPDIHKRLKVFCTTHEILMQEATDEALTEWLNKQEVIEDDLKQHLEIEER